MRSRQLGLVLALAGALLAGCGGVERSVRSDRQEACEPSATLVTFETDAFPDHSRLVVHADGRAELEWSTPRLPELEPIRGRRSFRIPAGRLEGLRAVLAEADFRALEAEYLPHAPITDAPAYRLTHCGRQIFVGGWWGGNERLVPLSLRRLVGSLSQLLRPELHRTDTVRTQRGKNAAST